MVSALHILECTAPAANSKATTIYRGTLQSLIVYWDRWCIDVQICKDTTFHDVRLKIACYYTWLYIC